MAARVSLKFPVNLRVSSTCCPNFTKVSNGSFQDGAPCAPLLVELRSNCTPLGAFCSCGSEFPNSFPYDWPASTGLCSQVNQTTFPLHVPRSCMNISAQKVLVSLPTARKSLLDGNQNFHIYPVRHPRTARVSPAFPMGPLRAVSSRASLPWVRCVLYGLSFPKVSHMIGQLLPASAPRSTKPHPPPCTADMYRHRFPEGSGHFDPC